MQTDPFIGRQIDEFTLQERIGRGGMATVYRAYQPSADRQVALKLITLAGSDVGDSSEFQRRFDQEARLISTLEHSNIVPVIKYGLVDHEYAYLAMRLLRGGSLSGLLTQGALPLERAVDLFAQVGAALAYAHSRGVIHRDLKPSNILLGDSGEPYLADFGLAKLVEQSVDLTKSGHIVGTPAYMSPEHLRGDSIDHRSDVYSMGVVLYHMVTGKPPFDASETNVVSVIYQHLEKPPPPPRVLNPQLPAAVELVILRALLKDPRDRYQQIMDMIEDLHRAVGRRISTTIPVLRMIASSRAPLVLTDSSADIIPTASYPQPPPPSTGMNPAVSFPGAAAGPRPLNPALLIAASIGIVTLMGVLIVMIALSLSRDSGTAARLRVTVQPFIITEDALGTAAQAVPTAAEIELAAAVVAQNDGLLAFIACTRNTEYHAAQAREIGDMAAVYGLPYRVYDPDSDPYRQVTLLEQARTDGAAALVICPLDMALLANSLAAVQAMRIPLVLLASGIENYGGVLLAGDDYQMGINAGRAAGEIAPSVVGRVIRAFVLDFPDLPIIARRGNGLRDGLQAVVPDAEIVGRGLGGTPDTGRAAIETALADGLTFNVILSINDAGAYGAIAALEAAAIRPEEVVITSVDAETLARRYIADDYYIRASVIVDREEFSRVAVNSTVRLLAGATLPETLLVPPGPAITRELLAALTPEPPPDGR